MTPASRAVDGDSTSDFNKQSCSQTLRSSNPWLVVDLRDVYYVASVTITNRGDCCGRNQ